MRRTWIKPRYKGTEEHQIKRAFKRLSKKGRLRTEVSTLYEDNRGEFHKFKFLAKISSFVNLFIGCLNNGFPIVVPWLWYNAWACWPFFFIKKNLRADNPIPILNHERIHVRQQRDIYLTFLPAIIVCGLLFGNWAWFILLLIFAPTLCYIVAMVHSLINLKNRKEENITIHKIRENTSFEREANSKALNYDYLHTRKFWAVLAYTGIPIFKNYGL